MTGNKAGEVAQGLLKCALVGDSSERRETGCGRGKIMVCKQQWGAAHLLPPFPSPLRGYRACGARFQSRQRVKGRFRTEVEERGVPGCLEKGLGWGGNGESGQMKER